MAAVGGTKNRQELLVEMLTNLIESQAQAEHDFCGEQRAWHLPRLNRAFVLACQLWPLDMALAMEQAKTPYGDPVTGKE